MYEQLGTVTLKDGEDFEAGVIAVPDLDWAGRVESFLAHQDELWNWQNRTILQSDVGVEIYFYVLHRGGEILSSMMSTEHRGVGLRGHVWTPPSRRGIGACSGLQSLQMEHFRARGGRFLALYTDYNSVPFHLYRKAGFEEVEPMGGHMRFCSQSSEEFERDYFAPGETVIEPLSWRHWPTAAPLFMAALPDRVRCMPLELTGRRSPEEPLLEEIRRASSDPVPRVMVLRNRRTGAVVGMAAWAWHPKEISTCVCDVYCHPHFWTDAVSLLSALDLPAADRTIAYADASCGEKRASLRSHGFQKSAAWSRYPIDLCRGRFAHLPRSPAGGRLAKACWKLAHLVEAPLSSAWRQLAGVTGAPARIPARWPTFPMTHSIHTDLVLYEKA